MSNATVLATLVSSPARALEAFTLERAGAVAAIAAGHLAKMGGATTIDGMTAKAVRAGIKKMKDVDPEVTEALALKFERDPSAFVKRGRVWLHVLFVEPEAVETVANASVKLREEMGQAMASTGAYNVEGHVAPDTIEGAKGAVVARIQDAVNVARENGKPVPAPVATLAKQLKVKGATAVKVKPAPATQGPNGAQTRLTLNALAPVAATTTNAPASWVEASLLDGTGVALKFKTVEDRENFEAAWTKAIDAANRQ